jgi:hypothetical protein
MKFSLLLFFITTYRNNIISRNKLYFEVGNNNNNNNITKNINKCNSTIKSIEYGDAALIPLKDLPKHPLLW